MSDRSLTWLAAAQLSTLYARRELSPVEVVEAMLARAEVLQPQLNAFVLIDEAGARAAAKAAQERWQKGAPLSPLDGVPTIDQGYHAGQGLADALRLARH